MGSVETLIVVAGALGLLAVLGRAVGGIGIGVWRRTRDRRRTGQSIIDRDMLAVVTLGALVVVAAGLVLFVSGTDHPGRFGFLVLLVLGVGFTAIGALGRER